MSFRAGTTTWFQLANSAAALQNLTGFADNISGPQTVQQLEVSVFGTASKVFVPGLMDGDTISVSGPLDATVWTQLTALKLAQNAGSAAAAYVIGWGGSVATYPKTLGSVYVANITPSAGVGGRLEYSASLQISGTVTNTVW